jgi:predicted dehydrogenase
MMASSERVRVCVVGLGPIGNLHATVYATDELAELVGVCDTIPERAKATGERLGVPYYTDEASMLSELSPQIVSIATGGFEYASDHHPATMVALEAGCHVLCEKPLSNELSLASEMVDEARKRGLCFGCDFNHRFTPAAYAAKSWVDEGLIGEQLFARMSLWIGRFKDPETDVYHLKALNPHSVDMLRYFCGEIDSVHCFATKAPGREIWSTASMNLRFASGAVGNLVSSYDFGRGHPMERCEVGGTEGRLVLDDMWREATLYPAASLEKRVYTNPVFGGYASFDDTFRARLHRFVEQVGNGVEPDEIDGSGADALAGLRVIFAAIESLRTGAVVDVETK